MTTIQVMTDGDEALRPILQLARDSANANLPTIRTVVLKAFSDPKVFTGFDEIKQVLGPRLSSGAGEEGEVLLRTLDLFSYGTYEDYCTAGSNGQFLPLSDTQLYKLRQLSLLTLVHGTCAYGTASLSKSGFVIPYATVAVKLGIVPPSFDSNLMDEAIVRQVEAIVLDCVYARVLTGRLCQKTKALYVSSRTGPPCRSRDVPLSRGAAMLQILAHFSGKVVSAQNWQHSTQEHLQMEFDANRNYFNGVLDRARKAESNSSGGGGGGPSLNNPILICGGGSVLGWPERPDERRGSDVRGSTSSQRQTKRSRGGVGAALDAFRY